MSDLEIKNPSATRRRKIVLVALGPIVAAMALWLAESGHWLVIYNDTAEPLDEISVQAGVEHWSVKALAPRESRRLRIHAEEPTDLRVEVANWAPTPAFHAALDGRHTAITTLRLDDSREVTATSEGTFWDRWLNW